jgi:hypothetical protein
VKIFGKSQPGPANVYEELRTQLLTGSRAALGIAPSLNETQPWGVVMDWNMMSGSATVVALADGNASVYLSSGGGSIGGGQSHESIRNASRDAMAAAAEVRARMHRTETFPQPGPQQVSLYVLTDAGIFSESAFVEEIIAGQHPLSRLGNAMQEIITQYRLIEQ